MKFGAFYFSFTWQACELIQKRNQTRDKSDREYRALRKEWILKVLSKPACNSGLLETMIRYFECSHSITIAWTSVSLVIRCSGSPGDIQLLSYAAAAGGTNV